MHNLNTILLLCSTYLSIGGIVWLAMNPFAYLDFVVSHYAQRTGRLPGNGFLVLSVAVAVVRWPWMVAVLVKGMLRGVRG